MWGAWVRKKVASSKSSSPGPKQPTPKDKAEGWIQELTGLFEENVEELIHVANIDCWPTQCQVLCSALGRFLGGKAGGLAWRWDKGSAKLQTELGAELKF